MLWCRTGRVLGRLPAAARRLHSGWLARFSAGVSPAGWPGSRGAHGRASVSHLLGVRWGSPEDLLGQGKQGEARWGADCRGGGSPNNIWRIDCGASSRRSRSSTSVHAICDTVMTWLASRPRRRPRHPEPQALPSPFDSRR